ncbi:MAG: CCA tRNA nucleotidyltransferase, partial [Pseudomonadota bacterium]|nr:CCA tRNA nucleotidyltransferase [Pseudomonadota bacterium]
MKPAGRIEIQPWMRSPATRAVIAALTQNGKSARFVGGCVRDTLIGRRILDIDIATEIAPEAVLHRLEMADIHVIATGLKHGTVTAVIDRELFEITTLRRDIESFGRHALVEFTDDWKADAARRDFTINAMFCDPDGVLYDPFGGIEDLTAGCIRFVGDARTRIREDVLRLLRFFRMSAHFGRQEPMPEALEACRAYAHLVPFLSGERVRGELLRLLEATDPVRWITIMADQGILAHVLPETGALARLSRLIDIETRLGARAPLRRLAALLDTDADGATRTSARLRLSNIERKRLVTMVAPRHPVRIGMNAMERHEALSAYGADLTFDLLLLAAAKS